MKLTLLRHGITEGNHNNLCYGSTDLPLLPEGIAALREAAQTKHYPKAEHYYTSGMRRTEQTLEMLYGKVPHEVLPGLREIDCGELEMQPFDALEELPEFRSWMHDATGDTPVPGGESFRQVLERGLEELNKLIAQDEDAVCVMHGGIMGLILDHWFPGKPFGYYVPHPGSGYQVTVTAGKPGGLHPVPEE